MVYCLIHKLFCDKILNNILFNSIIETINIEKYIDKTPKLSARSYAIIVIEPEISLEKQKDLVIKFNDFLNNYREKYNSLFLCNYRESKEIARKRISFDLIYNILQHLILF